jgi:CheY-like chemotaxis protein
MLRQMARHSTTSPGANKRARKPDPVATALAALAHEVRTPLNGIMALAELLAASDLPARERGWAEALKGAAEHLEQLTSVVVDGAKADATGLVLRAQEFSPRRLAEGIAASLQARTAAKGLQAAASIANDLPDNAIGDPVRLRAALENLIDNAVKFTSHGRIAFAASAEAADDARTRLVFSVTDDGIGLSEDEIGRLFAPFAQATEETAREYGGAGLGLAFARSVARAMGGDLMAESALGKGSTFRLEVVLAPAAPECALTLGSSREIGPSAAPLRILCAEDNPYGRVVMNAIAHALGHSVDFVGDGAAAVSAVDADKHDIVLMDLTLPGLDGMEATRRIRALPGKARTIPVIGVSGHTEADDAHAARTAGMDDYLAKPVSPAELARAIAGVAERLRRA